MHRSRLLDPAQQPDHGNRGNQLSGWLGCLAILFYVVHGIFQFGRGDAANLLWACHVADLCVGLGLLCRIRWLHSMGLLMLLAGSPLWALNLLLGGPFLPTTLLTHIGGLAIGLAGLFFFGPPRHDWHKALLLFVVLLVASRLGTPVVLNVNLAFALRPLSWEITSPLAHLVVVTLGWSLALWLAERAACFLAHLALSERFNPVG